MHKSVGLTVKKIRTDKGYSQNYVLRGVMTQSALSKFELNKTDIGYSLLFPILANLEITFEELAYVHNDFQFSEREIIYRKFFSLSYNKKEEVSSILNMAKEYLDCNNDFLIEDIKDLCKSLLMLLQTNNSKMVTECALRVWTRLSKKNQFYLTDLYLLNSITYLFPLETMLEIKKLAFKSIDRYKDFQNIQRLIINFGVNLSLMLIKEKLYKEALDEIEDTIILSKAQKTYLQLAVCYVRKGLCLNCLNASGDKWIQKGKEILSVLEEEELLHMVEKDIILH